MVRSTLTQQTLFSYACIMVGIVSRRCTGDNKWEETISCFNEETGNLLNQVVIIP